MMHQLFRIGSGFEGFTLMDDIQLAVTGHAGTSRNKFADDDIFLEAEERIFLAFDRCFGEDAGGFLEGSGGEEGVGRKSCLGGTEEQVFTDGSVFAFVVKTLVHRTECNDIDSLAWEPAGAARFGDLDLTQHLMNDDLDVFIVDLYALAAVNLLDFLDDIVLSRLYAEDIKDIVRVDVTFK